MGRRGPPPLPTVVKKLRGTYRRHRAAGEPAPVPGMPEPPAWLPKAARAEWDRIAPMLASRGLLEQIDTAALVGYCTAWSDLEESMRILAEEGTTCVDARGGLSSHPELRRMESARESLRKFAQEFGLSPSARTRVRVQQVHVIPPERKWIHDALRRSPAPDRTA